ncbi:MAG: ATP-binding cassette domain-containing protein [Coriobacteriales bacterium]|jgi:energy-coupling factor transport system ATP-binding protein|nr:ATP-binding cassette domain-containing protein [Coriobacteriales bacterium]
MQLVLDAVSYRYGSAAEDQYAIRELSFRLDSGDFCGIIGHSGSGKSTLIQLMAALIHPSSGRVLLDGLDLALPKHRTKLFTRIGVAFQYPEAQLFAPTVFEDIAFAARNAQLASADIERRVRHWMSVIGLDYDRYAHRSPFELSGGEQRRVALAGILVVEPELLILDEPTAGLDPAGRRRLLQVIDNYHDQGHTVVMVSHSMEDIAQVTNRILVLKDGYQYLQGSPQEIFSHHVELHEINLGVPASESLAASLRELGIPLPASLLSVDQLADAIAELRAQPSGSQRVGRSVNTRMEV